MTLHARLNDLKALANLYKSVLASPNLDPSTRQQLESGLANIRQQYAAVYAGYEAILRAMGKNVEDGFTVFP